MKDKATKQLLGGNLLNADITVAGELKTVKLKGNLTNGHLEAGLLSSVMVGGNMTGAGLTVGGELKMLKIGRDLSDVHVQAGVLSKVIVKNQVHATGEGYYIHAEAGSFLIKDTDDNLLIDDAGEWVDGLHACIV